MIDLLIKGASIIDGTGSDAFNANIGIKGGKIVSIGETAEDLGHVAHCA